MGVDQLSASILDAILNRRSIRRYRREPVPREVIQSILEAATWAPSAHNRQPWRFAVIESQSQKEFLAREMGARLRRDLRLDGVPEAIIEADAARSYDRVTSAPLLIALCLSMIEMDSYPDKKRSQAEYLMAVQSVAMAGQNLLLAAHEAGLGACWMCAPLFCPAMVRSALDLPKDWQPQALLTLGYPAEIREKTRQPVETKVIWR